MPLWILLCSAIVLQEPEPAAPLEPATPQEPAPPPVPKTLPPLGYQSAMDAENRLRALAAEGRASLIEIARSPEGIPVLAATFGERLGSGRPEVLIVANLEGDRLAATEIALRLCEGFAAGMALTDAATVHVVPAANPDATLRAFVGGEPWRGAATDSDRDGLLDEDGPRDLDGDGRALWMRVPDPSGEMIADTADARAARAAKKSEGEAGTWRIVREGADADGDRAETEDPPGGVRMDANFMQRWKEHAPESGAFALSEPEARGLADFVLAHPHIALVIVLDDEDNTADPPKGKESMERGASEWLAEDARLLKIWSGRLYGEDGKAAGGAKPRGAEDSPGSFADWLYFQAGIPVVESGVWSPPLDVKPEGAEDLPEDTGEDAKLLRWLDLDFAGAGFAPWREFEHPAHGRVEIGGWLPLVRENPPVEDLDAIALRWHAFAEGCAADFARLNWERVEVTDLGGGVFEARATLVNRGLMATMSAAGAATERPRPLRITLETPGGEILAGRMVQSVERLEGLGGAREIRWIYRAGPEGARIRAASQTAGEALVELEATR